MQARIDKVVASLWTTVEFLEKYPNIQQRYYLVQGFEPDFYAPANDARYDANQTHSLPSPLK